LKRWIVAVNKEMTPELVEKDFASYLSDIKWQLIKTALMKEHEVKIEEEDMKGMAREIAAAQLQQYGLFGLTDEQLDGFAARLLEDQKQRANLFERATENKIFALIKEGMKVEDQEISMEEFGKLFEK